MFYTSLFAINNLYQASAKSAQNIRIQPCSFSNKYSLQKRLIKNLSLEETIWFGERHDISVYLQRTGDRSINFSTEWIKNVYAFCFNFLFSRAYVVYLLIAFVVPTPRCKLSDEIKLSSFFESIFNIFQVLLFAVKAAAKMSPPITEVGSYFNFRYKNTVNSYSTWKNVENDSISLYRKRKIQCC